MNQKNFSLISADTNEVNLEIVLLQLQKDVTKWEIYLAQQQKKLKKAASASRIDKSIPKNRAASTLRINESIQIQKRKALERWLLSQRK